MVGRGGERRGAHSGEGEQLGVAGDALRPQLTGGGRRIRRLKTARWRRCRASGGPWIGGEEEGVEAELLGASARLGVAGGHGYGGWHS